MLFGHQVNLLKHENYYWKIGFLGIVLALSVHILFLLLFLILNLWQLVLLNVGSIAAYLYTIFGLSEKTLVTHDDRAVGWVVYLELAIHAFVATYYLGVDSGFQYYLYVIVLLPFFILKQTKIEFIVKLIGVVVLSVYMQAYFDYETPLLDAPQWFVRFMGLFNLTAFLSISAYIIYLYVLYERRHYDDLLEYSIIDPLTSLYNRRYFNEYVEKIFKSETFDNHAIAVSIIDIDRFKSINDTYGHHAGDIVIKETANRIRKVLSPQTVMARWGGEEFVVLHLDKNEEIIRELQTRMFTAVSSAPIRIDETTEIDVTVTVGTAVKENDDTFTSLFIKADEALYIGKREGRNKAVLF